MPRSRIPITALALLALGLTACSGGSAPAGARAPAGPRQVLSARAEATPYRRTLELGGTLEAMERVEIAARVEGALTAIEVDLGDVVRRGDTLARITADDFAARTAEIDAQLANARSELERTEQLVAADLTSRQALEQAHTRVRVAEAQRRLAGRQLRDTRVLAPFDGAIASRLVSPGAFVRVGEPMFVVVSVAPMRLAIDVPERHAGQIRSGTAVRVSAGARGDEEVADAEVARVAPVVDPASRTFRAEVSVPAEAGLVPGMYVRARIDLGAVDDAVRVPRAAVFEVLGRSRVVEVVGGRAQPRDVELIGEEGEHAIVLGLPAGAEVVGRSPGLLAPGTEVRSSGPESAPIAPTAPRAAGEPARGSGGS